MPTSTLAIVGTGNTSIITKSIANRKIFFIALSFLNLLKKRS